MLTEIKRKQQQKQQKHKNVLIELCVLLSFSDKQPGRYSSPSYVFPLSLSPSHCLRPTVCAASWQCRAYRQLLIPPQCKFLSLARKNNSLWN